MELKLFISKKLDEIFSVIGGGAEMNPKSYNQYKSRISSAALAEKLGLTTSMLNEFETAFKQFIHHCEDPDKTRISSFRLALWMETICNHLKIEFEIKETLSNEELAIKQVRALELMIRDIIDENLGGKDNLLQTVQQLFKSDLTEKWLKNADESGILSGTTFSELSNIFLDKRIFKGLEEIFDTSKLRLSKTSRDSLRHILEDIRLIRNVVAHNKQISITQMEAMNEYYRVLNQIIRESNSSKINPEKYLNTEKENIDSFLNGLKVDNALITGSVEEIKADVKAVKNDTSTIRKRTATLIAGILLLSIMTGAILHFVSKQSGSTEELSEDIKTVKEIVTGDAELKNMTSTDDLTATKELNTRTKDANAKRLAILYFDNSGGDPSMDKLKKGLADMLITDLSNVNMLDIVERDKLESILAEQQLSSSEGFDASTAAKVGNLLGAQVILTGGYFEMLGSLRLDARFIDVETGEILKSDGVDGQTSSFFKIQKQLSWKIIDNMDAKLTDEEKKQLQTKANSKAITIEDLNEYSQALNLYDSGNKNDAKVIADRLHDKYPEFEPLNNLLKKL